jgi:hypothetical protein
MRGMPKVVQDLRALTQVAETQVSRLNDAYQIALAGNDLPDTVAVEIKNLLENERSILDYLAMHIRTSCCARPKAKEKIFFPFANRRAEFSRKARRAFPGLEESRSDLWTYLDSVQPYPQRGESSLRDLVWLVNRKKHVALVRQQRREVAIGQKMPAGFGPAVFRKADFGASAADDGWIEFRFVGMKRSALWVLGRIRITVDEIAENVLRRI